MTDVLEVEGQRPRVAAVAEGITRDARSPGALIMTMTGAPPPLQVGTARTCVTSTRKRHAQRARLHEHLPRPCASSRCCVDSGTSL